MIPVAIGQEVGPDGIKIPPSEEKVITDPEPDVDKPQKIKTAVMAAVLRGKENI